MQVGSLANLRKVKVYGSRDSLFIVGVNKKEEAYEITEVGRGREVEVKRNFQVHTKSSYRNFVWKNGLEYVCKCEGVLGCIRFLSYPYLYVITKKEKVAVLFNEHKVYQVKSVLLIPFRDDVFENFNDENELVQVFYNSVNHKNIYFSYTYNLPCCVQENYYLQKEFLRGVNIHCRDYRNEYLWNRYHSKAFIRQNVFICVPTISGFFVQSKFCCEGKVIDVTFIARRCNKYAGTRYRKRGINAKGYSANQVETELILFQRDFETAILSYVQLRGSVPVFWSQGVNYHLLKRPKIKCMKNDVLFTCTKRHFSHLLRRYGYPIIAINLLSKNKHSDENNLSNEYEACIAVLNRDMPPPVRIIYKHLDLRKAYKIGTKYTLQRLKVLFNFSQSNVGYFYLRNGDVVVIQRGILRFNCVDCLDRTNAAQLFLKMYMLVHFLELISRVKKKALCVNHVGHLSQMYEELGDAIAKQYAGSTAHKKYTPGQSNNFFVQSKELLTSIKRYYISSFNDLEKQKSINLFLGVADDKLQDIRHAHDLDTRKDKVVPSMLSNLKFYRCFSETNVFKNLYNAHNWEGRFAQVVELAVRGVTEVGKAAGVTCASSTAGTLLLKSCGGESHAGRLSKKSVEEVLSPFERSLNLISHVHKFYDAHKHNFYFYFENKNVFRFRIWRNIATYNYLNYLKIFFDVFFLLYYCFCKRYNVSMVYMSHVNALCRLLGHCNNTDGRGNRRVHGCAPPLVNPYTLEKDVQQIIHQYGSYKKVSFALEPYLNYSTLNSAPYQYMLMSGRSLIGRTRKNRKRPPLRGRHPRKNGAVRNIFKRSYITHVNDSPVIHLEGKTHYNPIFKKKLIDQMKNRVVKGKGACAYYSRAYERSKRRCIGPTKGTKQLDQLEEQIKKTPRGYCPIYFNANMVKFFFFIYSCCRGGGSTEENAKWSSSVSVVRGIVMDLLRVAPPVGAPPQNMQLLLRQATQARTLQEFLSDLYMHYVYKDDQYKELNLSNLQNPNAPNCSDEKSKVKKSEQRFLLDEYDTFDYNLKKKKKKISQIDRKIKNEVGKHHAHLSREYLSVKHFTKTYFNEMTDLRNRDRDVNRFFLHQAELGNSQMANQSYHFFQENSLHSTRFDGKKNPFTTWTSAQMVPNFNVLRHRLEGQVDYLQYCNPMSRDIFRP